MNDKLLMVHPLTTRFIMTYVFSFLVGCCLVTPVVHAEADGSCTFTVTNCLSDSFMTSTTSEVRVYLWDGDDGVHYVATEDRRLSEGEVKDVSCNHDNCDTRVEGWVGHRWRYHNKNDSCRDLWIIEKGSDDFSLSTSSGC